VSSRVVVIVAAGVVVLAAGVGLFFLTGSPRPSPAATAAAPPPSPTVAPPASPVESPAPGVARPSRARNAPSPAEPAAAAPAEAAPTTGTLVITSDVPDSSVFIDRVYLGTAPVTAANLAPGQHHLNVSATGYDGVSETIDVAAGTHELPIRFKEVRLDAKLTVVHKHAMGSCSGTLSATPEGLTYAPTAGDHGFTAPLTSLETFEVDYLKKNLKVKIRGGRTYNFTDPDGNADRLFVFHRDVDKVRQRLSGGQPPTA
jgi:hypothetical protein